MFVNAYLTKIKSKAVSTYSIKHWAEHKLNFYVSTGAMKGALMLMDFDLDPYEKNAKTNVSRKCLKEFLKKEGK